MKPNSKPLTERDRFRQEYKARRGYLRIEYDNGTTGYASATAPRPCRTTVRPESQFMGMVSFYSGDDSIVWINTAKVLSMTWTPDDEAAS